MPTTPAQRPRLRDWGEDASGDYHIHVPSGSPQQVSFGSTMAFSRKIGLALVSTSVVTLAVVAFSAATARTDPPHNFRTWLRNHQLYTGSIEETLAKGNVDWRPPSKNDSEARCEWVIRLMTGGDGSKSYGLRHDKYVSQSNDENTFYRATANIFWKDFVEHGWGNFDLEQLGGAVDALADGSPLERKSTWTWISGDQHLSNFGAWRNRHGDVVFDVNDFDEAAVFDFQIDIWRLGALCGADRTQ